MAPIHLLFIVFIDLCWAMNMIAVKVAVDAVEPLAAVTLRYAIALLVTLPFIRWVPGRMRLIATTAIIAGAGFMLFVNTSLAVTDNVAALAIAAQLGAPFSLILAVIFLGERIRWIRIAGVTLAFVGIVIMGFDPAIWSERLGVGLTVISSLLWAVGSLLFRRLQGVPVMNIHGWLALISVPILGAASLIFEPGALVSSFSAPLGVWGWIAFSAIFSSLVGHAGMSWLLQKYDVSVIVPLTLPTPLISAGVAVFYFDLPITTGLVVGALVSFVGVAIITLRSAKKEPEIAEQWVRRARR
ncbi:DMT family transporter [Pacificimonas flava]|uniref:Permease of the drug/metabolite transporter (DMT) superfamily n=1 Tax=Pacificimonas flava TaxID=1234595 RepID=M2T8U8_9SPHN|nr:DMT family transporter [Pacificimonas flava]EMD82924.1 Permease of the drug/metabolite transporter (DMT) superfamily [Pacificimonas flava]MBB5280084.1 O-acetylserine/cysteine efflux transporter [Pacificimonas flava]